MKKYLVFIFISMVVVAAGFYINHRIIISNFNTKLQSAISKDQGLTETILKIEGESSSMSYQELFELCDKSVKERTDIIVELRGLNAELESTLKDSLVEFLNVENELIRNKSQAYRKSLSLSSDKKYFDEEMEQYLRASYYVSDIYKPTLKKQIKEVMESAQGLKDNVDNFINQYNLLSNKEDNIQNLMNEQGLKINPIYKKYQKSNLDFMKSNSEYADLIINKYKGEFDFINANW